MLPWNPSEAKGFDQLTLSAGGSPVSHLVLPGSKEARKMTVTSGLKCLESYQNLSPLGSLAKMLVGSQGWYSSKRLLRWTKKEMPSEKSESYSTVQDDISRMKYWKVLKKSDTKSKRLLFQLVPSMPHTNEKESLLWATPNTMDYLPQRSPEALLRQATGSRKGRTRPANLREQVDPEVVAMWPTPRANLVQPILTEKLGQRNKGNLEEAVAASGSIGGQLNPMWVEWLMGFPLGWSDLSA